ncbi:MAG: hypothetical protein LBB12_00120 [Holosporaceae bacterium]|jgi:hypothetical protein|nr:hypothetical protein [Holosporaceae bacterium]
MLEKVYKFCLLLSLFFYDSMGSYYTNNLHKVSVTQQRLCLEGGINTNNAMNVLMHCKGEIFLSISFLENMQKYLNSGARVNFRKSNKDSEVVVFIETLLSNKNSEGLFDGTIDDKDIVFPASELRNLSGALTNNCDLLVDIERHYVHGRGILFDDLNGIALRNHDDLLIMKSIDSAPLVKLSDSPPCVEERDKITNDMADIFALQLFSLCTRIDCSYEKYLHSKWGISDMSSEDPRDTQFLNRIEQDCGKVWLESMRFGRNELITLMILLDRLFAVMPQKRIKYAEAMNIVEACAFIAAKITSDYPWSIKDFMCSLRYSGCAVLYNEISVLCRLKFGTYISEEEYKEYNAMLGYDGDTRLNHTIFKSIGIRNNKAKLLLETVVGPVKTPATTPAATPPATTPATTPPATTPPATTPPAATSAATPPATTPPATTPPAATPPAATSAATPPAATSAATPPAATPPALCIPVSSGSASDSAAQSTPNAKKLEEENKML